MPANTFVLVSPPHTGQTRNPSFPTFAFTRKITPFVAGTGGVEPPPFRLTAERTACCATFPYPVYHPSGVPPEPLTFRKRLAESAPPASAGNSRRPDIQSRFFYFSARPFQKHPASFSGPSPIYFPTYSPLSSPFPGKFMKILLLSARSTIEHAHPFARPAIQPGALPSAQRSETAQAKHCPSKLHSPQRAALTACGTPRHGKLPQP